MKAAQRDRASGLAELAVLPGSSELVATPTPGAFQASRRRERRERELGSLRVGVRREIRIVEVIVSGRHLIEVRTWFRDHGGAWHPSRDSLSLPVSMFGEFVNLALAAARVGQS